MLVLTRYKSEKIVVKQGDKVILVIVLADIKPDGLRHNLAVRLGFVAPESLKIARLEIVSDKDKETVREMLNPLHGIKAKEPDEAT